jgi:hypothetical protein
MRSKQLLLTAALGLIMSALTVHTHAQALTAQAVKATSTPIPFLPFSITAPGTYVLTTSPAVFTNIGIAAITINVTVPGPVVLDLGGYTLSGITNGTGVTIQRAQSLPNISSITVRNGTIQGFAYGVVVGVLSPSYSSQIHIEHLTLKNIQFNQTNNSTISDCTFIGGGDWGIQDQASKGGNVYSNDYFDGTQISPIQVTTLGTYNPVIPLLLEHCQFQAPAK